MDFSSPTGPSSKRTKLDNPAEDEPVVVSDIADELDDDHCSICLQMLLDRTVIPECSHEFCFECIVTWSEQSRRCPLCTRTIGPYLIHHIRSNYDYQKYHLPPLRSSPPPIQPLRRTRSNRLPARERRWGRRARREQDVADELERAIDRRRWVYQNQLYAKHIGSNTFSRYRPFPTPAQFAASQDYISRATIFIRRELRVWVNLDVEFLTTFILSLLKAIDIRSDSAIKLLSEFLDMDHPYTEGGRFPNAEHFAHELYSFLRSPFKNLSAYDVNVQYDAPKGIDRRADNDDDTAAGRLDINEMTSLSNESHARPYNRQRSRLRDGGGYSRSNLNDQDTDDKFIQGSSSSARSPATSNGSGLSALLRNDSSNKPDHAYLIQLEDDQQGEHFSVTSHDSTRTNVKGKRRASSRDSCSPVTQVQVDGGDGHVHGEINRNDSRTSGEVEDGRTSGNVSADSDKSVSAGKAGDSRAHHASYQSQFATTNSRTRNPLLIAQAHLESEPRNKRKQVKNSTLVSTEIEDNPPKLRTSSETERKHPLLSRIYEPSLPMVRTNDATTHLSKACMESEDKDVPVKPENEDLRAKLLHRLEVERAIQAEQVGLSASAPENIVEIKSRRPNEVSVVSKLEQDARARARARLRMKLALEKHLSAPYPGVGNTKAITSEENPAKSTNREGLLRNVLENRRRVSQC